MKKGSSSITFFALIVAILLVALAANTFAIECGSVIVGNITLNESLNGCYNHGLVVEADNIVIDCDNYTIQSVDNQPFGFDQTAGILIKNRDNIEIRNCNINDFQDAILIENSNNNHIHNNHFNLNERSGIFLNRAKDNEKLSYSLITENYFNNQEKFSSDIIIYDNENHNTFTNANVVNNTIFFNNFYGNGIIDITEQNIYCVPNNQEGKGNFFNYTVPMARRITGPCGALPLPFDSPLLNGTVDDNNDDDNQTDGDNETDDDFSNEDDLPETSLSCGALVSGSIALANDLENCFSTAIEITENNVTLDCQGHTISGTNTLGSIGILVSQQENIVIKNCIIQYFDEGIKIVDSLNVLIESNTIRENSLGVTDLGSEDIQIKENTFKENEYAVELEENQNSVIAVNKFKENTLVGVHLTKSENIVVGTNEFTENKEAILLSEETDLVSINSNTLLNNIESGIFLTGISEHNEIKNNNIQGSNKCIVLDTSSENLVSENIIEDCNIGISVVGCYDNNITLNSISESVMSGLTYLESQNNWVTKNNFTNSLVGSLDLTNLGFAYNNVVVTNHFLGNGVDDSAIDNIYCWPNNENGVGNYYASTVADEFIVTGPCGMWDNNQTDSEDNETDDDDTDDDNEDDDTDDNDDDNNQTTSSKPNIHDVVITKIDDTSFRITFKTDKDTVSMISYRPDNMERVHMFDYEAKKDHEYILYNLKPCSEYAFYLRVEDNIGNYAYSPNYYFKTEGYCHQRSDGDSLTNSEDVQVLSIAIENEYVQPGDFVQAVLKVKNVGEFDRRRVKISAVIPDMGIVKFITNEHLDDNDKETFKLNIEIPFDTLPGDYWIRFTISNDEIKRVKHRLITVV
ncbi:hypothetical protein HN419_02755 [Candidatus Woesearchaeota archaeon]|jgi:parallel beta-helix repeat protein|nr:hypothetical protein [Candidatus Woesearchaeota archaeon]MBT3537082.1 hypothetical protein [Candidatus Woesearchaeota archaeon]MBT4697233.1 hypothetical protein [Candidatus Woesearchaeota archaeon]MBT4717002.1 hypothetical protein [Candidatus Woesearchaeota archaeon]MBT7106608.1 hypothetical protein [Candidatus Woesearchaeota archaeon]